MQILLNGETYEIETHCTVEHLLQKLALTEKRLAVEINMNIVPRSQFADRQLSPADRVEIIHAIGGG